MASKKLVEWHYPRTALAADHMRMWSQVGAHSLMVCAPRGAGKTEFACRDVMRAAGEAGFLPIYLNMFDDASSPAASMRFGLLRAAEQAGLIQKMREALSRARVADVKVGFDFGVAKFDVKGGVDKPEVREESILFSLRQIIDQLARHSGKPLLLVIDEVDVLASNPEHENFVKSLRTLLDERRGRLFTLFCGSSQARMDELFRRSKSPLFRFATQREFSPLGDGFLQHWRTNINKIMDAREEDLTMEHMREAFAITDRNPRMFWSSVVEMIQNGSVDVVAYARRAADPTGESSALAGRMAGLSALDRLLLRAIVAHAVERRDGKTPAPLELFSAAARTGLKDQLGMTPTPTQIQGSLLRLADGETPLVAAKPGGAFEIEDPYCLAWLQEALLEGGDAAAASTRHTDLDDAREVERVAA